MQLPRKLFLDTMICIDVANGKIPADEWNRVREHINTSYRYRISSITWKELVVKVANGPDQYFSKNREPLRVLYSPDDRQFLPYPSVFALRTVLGLPAARRSETENLSEEDWEETVLQALLDASSKAQVKAGVLIRNSKKIWTFDLKHFVEHENEPQKAYADLLQGMREDQIDKPNPRKWTAWILQQSGFPSYTERCDKLIDALDAAYRFSVTLSRMTNDTKYDFHRSRNLSDWGDNMQLFYLCDPLMDFLTKDGKCKSQTGGSRQSCRILLWDDFVASIP